MWGVGGGGVVATGEARRSALTRSPEEGGGGGGVGESVSRGETGFVWPRRTRRAAERASLNRRMRNRGLDESSWLTSDDADDKRAKRFTCLTKTNEKLQSFAQE